MWNINMKRGAIWETKSLNQYDYNYVGMTLGPKFVFILNVFKDPAGNDKLTYFKINHTPLYCEDNNIPVEIHNKTYYINLNDIFTGDQLALERFITTLPLEEINDIVLKAKQYFNLSIKTYKTKIERQAARIKKEFEDNCQRRIYKFGMDIYVTENENVSISSSDKLILSDSAKYDIINNSKTNEDIQYICQKYKIYPAAAIKQIRSRLVYQQKIKSK